MNPANATATEAGGGDEYEVGKTYEVKLTTGIEFKGIVLAYDSDPHVIIFHILSILLLFISLLLLEMYPWREFLQEGTSRGNCKSMTTRTVNASFISKANLIGKCKDPLDSNKKKCFVDLNGLLEKEAIAIRLLQSLCDWVEWFTRCDWLVDLTQENREHWCWRYRRGAEDLRRFV